MKLKAIFIGIISYTILLAVWFFISPPYEHQSLHVYSVVMTAIYILLPFISGYITATFAKEKYILNGFVFTIIIASLSAISWFMLDIFTLGMLFNLIAILVLGTAGAASKNLV